MTFSSATKNDPSAVIIYARLMKISNLIIPNSGMADGKKTVYLVI